MTTRRQREARAVIAWLLREDGMAFADIATVLNLTTKAGRPWKERARQLAAKGRNLIRWAVNRQPSGLPRIMWADVDKDNKTTPVAVYTSKADQRGNRPDLKPIRVIVAELNLTRGEP